MGETLNLVFENPPKKLEYVLRLKNYDQKDFMRKTKNFFTRQNKTEAYSISKWCEIIDDPENENSKYNSSIRSFLDTLVEEDVLVQDGFKDGGTKIYRLDKKALINCYYRSYFYQLIRDLNIETINKEERFKSVVTDVSL